MKTIIAGGRNIVSLLVAKQAIKDSEFVITEVVSGTARGADTLGEEYADNNGIPIKPFKPDWDKYGKRAGFIRNADMGNYAQGLIALWDGKSKGIKHMIDYATKKELKVYVANITVIEVNDSPKIDNINEIVQTLKRYKSNLFIKEFDVIIVDQKINISYIPGNIPEIEKTVRYLLKK